MSSEKKKKRIESHSEGHSGGEEGEGSWLISYADLMTLLVGFFVILMSFSQIDQEKFEEVKKSASKEFGGAYQAPFVELQNKIKDALDKMGLGDQFLIKATQKGVDVSFLGPVFFATGSADFRPEAKPILDAIIPVIHAEKSDFDILIEGHTDDVPLSSKAQFKNNWELSSIRACRVLEYFAQNDFDAEALTAVGYGETRPLAPNRDANGIPIPLNQSQNRRVVLRLVKKGEQTL